MEEEQIPPTSSQVVTEKRSLNRRCTIEEKTYLTKTLKPTELRQLARFLGLEESEIDEIELDDEIHNYGFRETVYQTLVKWEQIKGSEATAEMLIVALLSHQRNDIVRQLFPDYSKQDLITLHPLRGILQDIQRQQKKKYRELMLPRTLWLTKKRLSLEEFYVELTMKKKDKWGTEGDVSIQREEIFDKMDIEERTSDNSQKTKIPLRILVEGDPGYGKTTLVTKLLFDWSRGEKYVRDKFDMFFVISLRKLKGNLENHLLQQIRNVNGSDEDKLEAIKEVEGRVLLLLDGLDECNERVKENLRPLFNGDQYPQMTVFVTCRTGFIHFEQESDDDFDFMGNTGFEYHLIWDKRIQIKGISLQKRLEFLQKYLDIDYDKLKTKLFNSNLIDTDFYECPLFLMLSSVFVKEGGFESIKSKTQLYKKISNFVVCRNLNRESLAMKEFDMFYEETRLNFEYRKMLLDFGRLCLEKRKKESLIFEERELLECSGGDEIILKLGFVSKELSFDNYEEEKHYEPIHRSFLDFFAAFYLSSFDETEMKKEIDELLMTFCICPGYNEPFYSFLGGFLQNNACKLLKIILSSRSDLIPIFKQCSQLQTAGEPIIFEKEDYYHLGEILLEIHPSDDIFKSLVPYFPLNWNSNDIFFCTACMEPYYEWLVGLLVFIQKSGIANDIILEIPKDVEILNKIEENGEINTIVLNFESNSTPDTDYYLTKKFGCQKLIISYKKLSNEFSDTLKEILSMIKFKENYLEFVIEDETKDEDMLNIFKKIVLEHFENFDIHCLTLKLCHQFHLGLFLPAVKHLIEIKKIRIGEIRIGEIRIVHFLIPPFVDFVINSHLISISVQCKNVLKGNIFNLERNISNNECSWERDILGLDFTNFGEYWQQFLFSLKFTDLDVQPVKILRLEYFETEKLVSDSIISKVFMTYCKGIKVFHCTEYFWPMLDKLLISHWEGFQTVEYLKINYTNSLKTSSYLNIIYFLLFFKNIYEINLPLLENKKLLFEIVANIKAIRESIKKICFNCAHENNPMKSYYDFFYALKFLETEFPCYDEKFLLNEIEVNFNGLEEPLQLEFYEILEKCFLKNFFGKFSVSGISSLNDNTQGAFGSERFKISSDSTGKYVITYEISDEIKGDKLNFIMIKICDFLYSLTNLFI